MIVSFISNADYLNPEADGSCEISYVKQGSLKQALAETSVVCVILFIYLLVSCYFGGIYSSIISFNHPPSTNRAFSHDITPAMLVIQTNPMGDELFS